MALSACLQCLSIVINHKYSHPLPLKRQTDYVYIIIRRISKSMKYNKPMFGQHIQTTRIAINLFNARTFVLRELLYWLVSVFWLWQLLSTSKIYCHRLAASQWFLVMALTVGSGISSRQSGLINCFYAMISTICMYC